MTYYDNPGQVNDEAISIVDGKTFQVIQLADSSGNIVDPASGTITFDGEVTIGTSVEISNDVGNPIPVSDAGVSLTIDNPELTSLDGKIPGNLTVSSTRLLVEPSLPPDAATQTTLAALLTELELKADLPETQPVSSTVPISSPTTTSVNSSTASVTILAANSNRRGISVANDSTSVLRLSFTSPATNVNAFIVMQPKSFLLLDQQLIVDNAIYGIWDSANGTAQVTEYV